MNGEDQQPAASSAAARPDGRLPKIAGGAALLLLALVVADGIRNQVPGDQRLADKARPEQTDDLSASFPRYATSAREEHAGCDAEANGPAVTDPRPIGDPARWLTSIDYPLVSLQKGHEGISGMMMTITRSGMVADCRIMQSSGHPLLDNAACTTLRTRARFEPARNAEGCPVPVPYRQRVRWQIPIG